MKFKKSYGQNFLRDKKYVDKIVDCLFLDKEVVVEIGPGSGQVTRCIIDKAAKLYCIEKDLSLIKLLKQRFESERVSIINQDILDFDIAVYLRSDEELRSYQEDQLKEILKTVIYGAFLLTHSGLPLEEKNKITNIFKKVFDYEHIAFDVGYTTLIGIRRKRNLISMDIRAIGENIPGRKGKKIGTVDISMFYPAGRVQYPDVFEDQLEKFCKKNIVYNKQCYSQINS